MPLFFNKMHENINDTTYNQDKVIELKTSIAKISMRLYDEPNNIGLMFKRMEKMRELLNYLTSIPIVDREIKIDEYVRGKKTGKKITVGKELKKTRAYLYTLIENSLPKLRQLKTNDSYSNTADDFLKYFENYLKKFSPNGEYIKTNTEISNIEYEKGIKDAKKRIEYLSNLPRTTGKELTFSQEKELAALSSYGIEKPQKDTRFDSTVGEINLNILTLDGILSKIDSQNEYSPEFLNTLVQLFANSNINENFGKYPNFEKAKEAFNKFFYKISGYQSLEQAMPKSKMFSRGNELTYNPKFIWNKIEQITISGDADIQDVISKCYNLQKLNTLRIISDKIPNSLSLRPLNHTGVEYLTINPISGKSKLSEVNFIPNTVKRLNLQNNNLQKLPSVSNNTEIVDLKGNPLTMLGITPKGEHNDNITNVPDSTKYIIDTPIATYAALRNYGNITDNQTIDKKTKETKNLGGKVVVGATIKSLKYDKKQEIIVAKGGETPDETKARQDMAKYNRAKQKRDALNAKEKAKADRAREREDRNAIKKDDAAGKDKFSQFKRNIKLCIEAMDTGDYSAVQEEFNKIGMPNVSPSMKIEKEKDDAIGGQIVRPEIAFELFDYIARPSFKRLFDAYNKVYNDTPIIPISIEDFKSLRVIFGKIDKPDAASEDKSRGILVNNGTIVNIGGKDTQAPLAKNLNSRVYNFKTDLARLLTGSNFYDNLKYIVLHGDISGLPLPKNCVTVTFKNLGELKNRELPASLFSETPPVKKIVLYTNINPNLKSIPNSVEQLWLPFIKTLNVDSGASLNDIFTIFIPSAQVIGLKQNLTPTTKINFNIVSGNPSESFRPNTKRITAAQFLDTIKASEDKQSYVGKSIGISKSTAKKNTGEAVFDKIYYDINTVRELSPEELKTLEKSHFLYNNSTQEIIPDVKGKIYLSVYFYTKFVSDVAKKAIKAAKTEAAIKDIVQRIGESLNLLPPQFKTKVEQLKQSLINLANNKFKLPPNKVDSQEENINTQKTESYKILIPMSINRMEVLN